MVNNMKKLAPQVKKYKPEFYEQFLEALPKVKCMRTFDEYLTAPYMGLKGGAEEYYQNANWKPYLDNLKTPFMVIQSEDDFCVPIHALPLDHKQENFLIMTTACGAHCVNITGNLTPKLWIGRPVVDFLDYF